MTREELKNNEKLFVTEYDNMTVYAQALEINAATWRVDPEDNEVTAGKIVHVIFRSNNPEKYDEASDEETIGNCPIEYDIGAEFVTDDDIVFVFIEEE